MLPNDNVSMSVGHLDHFLIVYSSMEHVTWKSPSPMCGWVGRILHRDSCTSVSSWSTVPLLSIWSVAVSRCRPLLLPSRWHGSLPRHGLWWLTCELHCSPLPWRFGSVYHLWKSPLLSYVPWSSNQTSCLSLLQHMSWSSSCKGHDRSNRTSWINLWRTKQIKQSTQEAITKVWLSCHMWKDSARHLQEFWNLTASHS